MAVAVVVVAAAVVIDPRSIPALFAPAPSASGSVVTEQPAHVFEGLNDVRRYTVAVQCDESVSALGEPLVQHLESQGYDVRRLADDDVSRTVVVHQKRAFKPEAEALFVELGRVLGHKLADSEALDNSGEYTFESDLLILVGRDAL